MTTTDHTPADPAAAAAAHAAPDPAADAATTTPELHVRLFAAAAAEYGADAIRVRARTLGEALDQLSADGGERAATVIGRCSLLLNGVASTDRSRPLADGDQLDVLPPFAGG